MNFDGVVRSGSRSFGADLYGLTVLSERPLPRPWTEVRGHEKVSGSSRRHHCRGTVHSLTQSPFQNVQNSPVVTPTSRSRRESVVQHPVSHQTFHEKTADKEKEEVSLGCSV